jgi:LytR cell envelope-related transcriptional attenuator
MTGGPEADARRAEVDQKGRDSGDTTPAVDRATETTPADADDPDPADTTAGDDGEPDAEKPAADAHAEPDPEADAGKPAAEARPGPDAEPDTPPDAEPHAEPEPEVQPDAGKPATDTRSESDAEPDAQLVPDARPDPDTEADAEKPTADAHTEPDAQPDPDTEADADKPAAETQTFDTAADADDEPRTAPAGSGDTVLGASTDPDAWGEAGAERRSAGPRFTPPPYDPDAVAPPPSPSLPDDPDDPDEPDEPFPAQPAAPAVPQQYTTGNIPIVEIEGGWDAVYRRRRRHTVTFLGGLALVLVVGFVAWLTYAGVVRWPFGGAVTVAQSVCTRSQPLPPKKIAVRVFNGSARNGLAGQVSVQLKALGFGVKVTGNDPLEARIKTPVQIRHGANGNIAAATMSAYVVGKVDQVQDDRQDSTIDLVLGPSYSRLHTKTELKKSLAAVTATLPLTCPPGVTPTPTPTPSSTPKARVTPRPTASPKR